MDNLHDSNEPVAWMIWTHGPVLVFMNKDEASMEFDRLNHAYPEPTRMLVPLYTSPQPAQQHIEHCIWARCGNRPCPHVQPRREWVGLTEDEKTKIRREHYARTLPLMDTVEAKLREKNA